MAEGSMPLERGVALFDQVFDRLRRAAKMRRTRRGTPALDIGAITRSVIDEDRLLAQRADVMMRAA
eukprot:3712963-Pleurochrysis_carterae.AAC.1